MKHTRLQSSPLPCEYLIVFKGDDFDPIHAMSFERAVDRVEEWIGNGAEIHYALEVELTEFDTRRGSDCTWNFMRALYERELAREAEAAKAYVDTGEGDYKRKLVGAE